MMNFEAYIAGFVVKMNQAGFTIAGEKKLEYGRQIVVTSGSDKVGVNIYHGKKGISVVVGGAATSTA